MGKTKIYNFNDIVLRRLNYIKYIIFRRKIYDYEQQVLMEFSRCQKQRKIDKPAERAYLRWKMKKIKKENKFIVSRIAVSVSNQCSLNCRDCNNLMPYCKEKFTIEINEQIQDLEKLLSYVDGIINVEVIGGEPFVYKQLPELLQYLCAEPKIQFIEITSNGTVMPPIEMVDILKHSKICVLLSDYGMVNTERAQKTYQWLRQNQICVQNLKNKKWVLAGNIERRKKNKLRLKYEYFHCNARKNCRTLYKGKLYVCGRAPVLDELGVLKDGSSFLNIREMNQNMKIGRKQLNVFFNNDYAECCAYCDYASDYVRWIESGIQK